MDHWYSQNTSPSPRGALGDSFLQQPGTNIGRSSISFIQRDSSVVHGLSSSKRVRYDWDVEWRLAAEASTRVVAKASACGRCHCQLSLIMLPLKSC